MNKISNFPGFAVFLALASGCGLSSKVPGVHFDTPESLGRLGRKKLEAAYGMHGEAIYTENVARSDVEVIRPPIGSGRDLRLGGGIGLTDAVDLELRLPMTALVKWQFLGASRLEAVPGGFSAAVLGEAGLVQSNVKTEAPFLAATGEARESQLGLRLLAGYRFNPEMLLYAGAYANRNRVDLKRQVATGALTEVSTWVSGDGGVLGFEFGTPGTVLKVEGGLQTLRVGENSRTQGLCGVSLSFLFGADRAPE